MEFTNLNLLTLILVIAIISAITFLPYKLYFNQIKFNKEFNLLSSFRYFYIKYLFLIISLFIVLLASFWIKYWEKKLQNESKWIDMMFVLDVSKSMNVADMYDSNYAYTRLDIIKDSISKFVVSHKEDRFWLTIFAWDAVSTIPLTTDHDLFLTFIKWVDYRNLTKQWSDFEKALSLWIDRFNNSDDRSKILIFVSDWWDFDDNINKYNIEKIKSSFDWITYSVIWIWTNKWWKIITWKDFWRRPIYQKYKWEYVVSKINRSNLKDIASALNWGYIEVTDIWDLDKINKNINNLEKKVLKKDINWELWDYWRKLTYVSFIFFIIFILLYIFENKLIFIKENNE